MVMRSIEDWCRKLGLKNYDIINGVVNVNDDVNLSLSGLYKIPIQFGIVSGRFNCSSNKLTILDGCSKKVCGDFFCGYNLLTSLKGGPIEVGGYFNCSNNQLTSLEGAPNKINDGFNCSNNNLESLEGGPIEVSLHFNCQNNKLISLEGSPKKLGDKFYCENNPVCVEYVMKYNKSYTQYIRSIKLKEVLI
jgi:hypothetical protein